MASSLETGRAKVARCTGSRAAARISSTAAPQARRSRGDIGASLRYADRMLVRPMLAALLVAATLSSACRPSAGTSAAPTPDPRAVVAEVDGAPITAEELDRQAAG